MRPLDLERYSSSQRESIETFEKEEAQAINRARLEQLASLSLPLEGKKVLDVGCGVGHLAQFFVARGCTVTSIDAREENLQELAKKYPSLTHARVDVEHDDLTPLGTFDIVFCYGLLYHTENPVLVIEKLAAICSELLLLETCVSDSDLPLVRYVEETSTASQALRGIGSRPSAALITSILARAGFVQIYEPVRTAAHPDFRFTQRNDLSHARGGHNLRKVFIASREPLFTTELKVISGEQEIVPFLHRLAGWLYIPRPLVPAPAWHVGIFENEKRLSWYRQCLQRLWLTLKERAAHPVLIRWVRGIHIQLSPETELSRALYIEGCYEPNELVALSELLKPGMHFVDVGANNGWFCLFAASYTGPEGMSYAIEPSPRELKKIEVNVRLNPALTVQVLSCALGATPSSQELSVAEDYYEGHNTLGRFIYNIKERARVRVPVRTLDQLVQGADVARVDVLKVDVEGAELMVLRGAQESIACFRPVVLIELCGATLAHQGAQVSDVLTFFKDLNYEWYEFSRETGRPVPCHSIPPTTCTNYLAAPKEKPFPYRT